MHGRRIWSLLLLPGGLAVGHVLGFWAARLQGEVAPLGGGGHNSVHVLLAISVPLSLAVLARVLVGGARDERLPVTVPALATQQVVAFVALELLEHHLAGVGALEALAERTTLWGIVAQVLVAAVLVLLLSGLGTVARRLRPGRRRTAASAAGAPTPVLLLRAGAVVPVWSLSRRGPPLPAG